jgi:hypothetical protein
MTTCERCGKQTNVTIMSMFNTDILCSACKDTEREHPNYAEAVEAETNAVLAGNTHFAGIGLPEDL